MQEELRKKVVYEEQQVKYLQKEMDREHSFQLRIQRERKENQKKSASQRQYIMENSKRGPRIQEVQAIRLMRTCGLNPEAE